MRITTALERFCDEALHLKAQSPRTISRYRTTLGFFIRAMELEQVADVNDQVVRDFLVMGRAKRGWKAVTYNTYYLSLLVFLRWCVERGELPENYVKQIPKQKLPKALPKRVSLEDAKALLRAASRLKGDPFIRARAHAIVATLLYAGLRRAELLQLTLADLDWETKTIYIRRGKGEKDRVVPMCAALERILRQYLTARKRFGKRSDAVFTCVNTDRPMTVSAISRVMATIRYRSGVKFSPHKLRHTFATLMIEGGCDVYALSKMMGHADIKTTTIYLSASTKHLHSLVANHPLNGK